MSAALSRAKLQRAHRMGCPSRLARGLVAGAALAAAPVANAADMSVTWLGGSGGWNVATNWSPAVVPNNGAQTFDATINSGTASLTSNITLQKLTLTGGTIHASSTLYGITANELATISGGTQSLAGLLSLGGMTLSGTPAFSDSSLTLSGASSIAGGSQLNLTRTLIRNSGTLTAHSAPNVTYLQGSLGTLVNTGTLNIQGQTALLDARFVNSGTVSVSGMFSVLMPSSSIGATYILNNNTLSFSHPNTTFDATTTFSGNGQINLCGLLQGHFSYGGGEVYIDGPITFSQGASLTNRLYVTDVAVRGGSITASGTSTFAGSTLLAPVLSTGSAVNIPYSLTTTTTINHTFTNQGTFTQQAPIRLLSGPTAGIVGTFNNHATFVTTGSQISATTGIFNNYGTYRVNLNQQSISAPFLNAGTLDIQSSASFSALLNSGGTVTGPGTLISSGQLRIAAAGQSDPSTAQLAIDGNLTLNSPNSLFIQLGGTTPTLSYDTVQVDGNVALGGVLSPSFTNGFLSQVQPTDSFTIITAGGNITGTFSNASTGSGFRVFFPEGSFLVTYSAQSVTLSNYQSIPEPGALTALMALGTLLPRRRR